MGSDLWVSAYVRNYLIPFVDWKLKLWLWLHIASGNVFRMRRLVQIVRGLISWLAYLLLFLTLYSFLALQTTQGDEGCLETIWSWFIPEPNAMKNVKERSKAFYLSHSVPFCVTISGIHVIFVSSPNWCLTKLVPSVTLSKCFHQVNGKLRVKIF